VKHPLKHNWLLIKGGNDDERMKTDNILMIHFYFVFISFFIRGFSPSGERLHSQPDAGIGRGKHSFVASGDLAEHQQFGN
jgi:hypothetical protein